MRFAWIESRIAGRTEPTPVKYEPEQVNYSKMVPVLVEFELKGDDVDKSLAELARKYPYEKLP